MLKKIPLLDENNKVPNDLINDGKIINAITVRYSGTINIDDVQYNNATIISFRRFDADKVGAEIGILTYPNIGKRLVYRFAHGYDMNTKWTSIT